MKRIFKPIIEAILILVVALGLGSVKAEAADTLKEISNVHDLIYPTFELMVEDGLFFQQGKNATEEWPFTINERGWVAIVSPSRSLTPSSGSVDKLAVVAKNDGNKSIPCSQKFVANFVNMTMDYEYYYLDPGSYIIKYSTMYCGTEDHTDHKVYALFLPNSKVIDYSVKHENCLSDKVTISLSEEFTSTSMREGAVPADDIMLASSEDKWHGALSNADNIYAITKNGEYTFRVAFKDPSVDHLGVSFTVSIKDIEKHETIDNVIPATTKADGRIDHICKKCPTLVSYEIIPRINAMEFSKSSVTYNGKAQKPALNITTVDAKKPVDSKYYSVTYKDNKNVGVATVTVTFKGNYSGKLTGKFTIAPKGTSLKSLKKSGKSVTVKWKQQSKETTGYEIQYATSSDFKKNAKTVTVKGRTKTSKTITKLKKKTYYVRVRTYKEVKVNGKKTKIYSGWSSKKKISVK